MDNNSMLNKVCIIFYKILLPIFSITLSTFVLEFSVFNSYSISNYPELKYSLLNIATIGILYVFIYILVNRIWLSTIIISSLCGMIAIVNHFVVMLHGMPLSFLMIKNIKTAVNVAGEYQFSIDKTVLTILLIVVFNILLSCISGQYIKNRIIEERGLVKNIVLIVICYVVFYIGYLSPDSIKPMNTIGWLWQEPYYLYGYTSCTVETMFQTFNYIKKPEGFDESNVLEILDKHKNTPLTENVNTPDIILILNETFYDLSQIIEIETDVDYMKDVKDIDNLYTGYAIVPSAGGGTNNSEYELLTSNSLQIMPAIVPFNTIDLNNANSIVSHLEKIGYTTFAAHSLSPQNYSRGIGYPSLGFDDVYFETDFKNLEGYRHESRHTDESVYKNMIRWYEAMPEDKPRFSYLLTYQNHSPYTLNSDSNDTVHTLNDYGDYTDDINEFLSCIELSCKAFKELTEYFEDYNRDVVICMVGDHAPALPFYGALELYNYVHEGDTDLLFRKTPLFIWSNFELENIELQTIGINQVMPTVLQMAGVPMNRYYNYLTNLKESVPIISVLNRYYDKNNICYEYANKDSVYYEDIRDYFYLEYYNLTDDMAQDVLGVIK